MRTSRRRFVHLSAGVVGVGSIPFLSACGGEDDPTAIQGWASSDVAGSEVQQGQPGGVPDVRARVGLVPGVLVIAGIQFAGEDSFVRIINLNTAVMTMIGWQLCSQPSYWEIPDIGMDPEQVLDIGFGSGVDVDGKIFMNGALPIPDPAAGELAFYTSTKFDRASAIFHYVQWGKTIGGREEIAVKAELWEAGAFIDAGPLADGGVLEYDGRVPGQGNWIARAGTL